MSAQNTQKKSIRKTILILVLGMCTILVLFLNKITTPRYLSNIELKINGLVLLKQPITFDKNIELDDKKNDQWLLVMQDGQQQTAMEPMLDILRSSLREQLYVTTLPQLSEIISTTSRSAIVSSTTRKETIALIKPNGSYIAYLKPPYEKNKLLLTLSSVLTHR